MKLLALLFLVGFVTCAPRPDGDTPTASASKEDDKLVVTKDYFVDEFVQYTGEHDIVRIHVPLIGIDLDTDDKTEVTLFFVEADMKEDGKKDYKGLYMLKDKKATKLLDNGRDTTSTDNSHGVYFGASDGIYKYNAEKNTAEKYGTLTDSIKGIEKMKVIDSNPVFFILTDDDKLHKVSEGGTKKETIEDIPHAHEICMDYSNNLFYFGHDMKPHVKTESGIKKIEGLPEDPKDVRLVRAPFIYSEGVVFISDAKPYVIYPNGTSEATDYELQIKPTAYAPEATLLQYYGYDKKIYEFNVLSIMLGEFLDELKNYLNTLTDAINAIAEDSKTENKSMLGKTTIVKL